MPVGQSLPRTRYGVSAVLSVGSQPEFFRLHLILCFEVAPQDEGDAVAEATHVHRAAVLHHVGLGLHLGNALALVHDFVQRRAAP